jgi:hypothetical protein
MIAGIPKRCIYRADLVWDSFFNDMLAQGWPAPFWYMLRVFYDGDSYPPLGLYFKFFDVAVSVFSSKINLLQKLMSSRTVYHRLWVHCKAHRSTEGETGVIFITDVLVPIRFPATGLDAISIGRLCDRKTVRCRELTSHVVCRARAISASNWFASYGSELACSHRASLEILNFRILTWLREGGLDVHAPIFNFVQCKLSRS